jgi:hypothetical protein
VALARRKNVFTRRLFAVSPVEMLKVAAISGVAAGLVVAAAWTFQYLVFELPGILAIVVAGVLCNVVFLVALRWVDGAGSAVKLLLAWAVLVPVVGAAVAFLVRGFDGGSDPAYWSLSVNTHFMAQAAVRSLIGVACAAWLLLRASVRAT